MKYIKLEISKIILCEPLNYKVNRDKEVPSPFEYGKN